MKSELKYIIITQANTILAQLDLYDNVTFWCLRWATKPRTNLPQHRSLNLNHNIHLREESHKSLGYYTGFSYFLSAPINIKWIQTRVRCYRIFQCTDHWFKRITSINNELLRRKLPCQKLLYIRNKHLLHYYATLWYNCNPETHSSLGASLCGYNSCAWWQTSSLSCSIGKPTEATSCLEMHKTVKHT